MKDSQAKNQNCASTNISPEAVIDQSAIIQQGACIVGKCKIGANVLVGAGSVIEDSQIEDGTIIKCSYIEKSVVKTNVQVGPFAHIRPNSIIEHGAKIGNFVEIKNSKIGEGTKVSHLAYVGDADVGKHCNIGCGVIFANYNGKCKSRTVVGDGCFVGSNSNLIAPLVVAKNTYICAGTTLTKDTQPCDFVIGRAREIIKVNYAQNYLKELV